MEFKEITAKTVDEAITKACLEFETSSDNLEIQVVQEGTPVSWDLSAANLTVIKVRKKGAGRRIRHLKRDLQKKRKRKRKPLLRKKRKNPKKNSEKK